MGTASDEVSTGQSGVGADETDVKKAQIIDHIRNTREDMSHTLGEIEHKLNPTRLKNEALHQFEEAKDKVKEEVIEQFESAKEKLKEEIHEAKDAVRQATIGRVEHMVHDARDTVTDAGSSILETIKANPIPYALTGVGIAWLLLARQRPTPKLTNLRRRGQYASGGQAGYLYEYDREGYHDEPQREQGRQARSGLGNGIARAQDKAGNVVHTVQNRAADVARGVQEAAGGVIDQVQHAAGQVRDQVQHTAGQVRDQVQHTAGDVLHGVQETASHWRDQAQEQGAHLAEHARREAIEVEAYVERAMRETPLAVGAVALALGVAAGLALPHTQREDELLGEAREQLFEKASDVAHETVEKVEKVAKEVTNHVASANNHHA